MAECPQGTCDAMTDTVTKKAFYVLISSLLLILTFLVGYLISFATTVGKEFSYAAKERSGNYATTKVVTYQIDTITDKIRSIQSDFKDYRKELTEDRERFQKEVARIIREEVRKK